MYRKRHESLKWHEVHVNSLCSVRLPAERTMCFHPTIQFAPKKKNWAETPNNNIRKVGKVEELMH